MRFLGRSKFFKGEIKTYRDLIVWQKAMVLVTDVYSETKGFPKDEQFGITSQLRRCSVSIPSNIAEGYGRFSTKDYLRFLKISRGSLFELQTQLEICKNLNYLSTEQFTHLNEKSREIERMLSALLKSISKSNQ